MTTPPTLPRLKDLGLFFRLGITCLVVTLLGGYVVSGIHLQAHYDNRDERPGFTLDDDRAAYHGISAPSPLRSALQDGHPEQLGEADRAALLAWLDSGNLSRDYDNLDLGDEAPAEIIAVSCLDCHARGAEDAGSAIPLEYWDDVRPLAFSTEIQPTPDEIIAISQHTHAPTMAMVLLIVGFLGAMTRWPRSLTGLLVLLGGAGLLIDMAGWWLAKDHDAWVYAIVGGGLAQGGSVLLLGLLSLIDMWLPGGRSRGD
ncbi:MAG: hypothetical protein ACIARR_12925 [Phycisphaerales bacterium JB059]